MNYLISLFLLLCSCLSNAELAVIVHPDNSNTITEEQLKRIFLGKLKNFEDGSRALVFNQKAETSIRVIFDEKVIKRTPSQMKAYWAKEVFSGKASAPIELASDAEVIDAVTSTPGAIGYIDIKNLKSGLKVILTVK